MKKHLLSQLRVPKVIYTTVPVEYPDIFLEGVVTIYNVTGWENPMDAFLDVNPIHIQQIV
ncbi:15372_t:CDS:2 [Funneliformis caledonium]|uniref:15372_t:CDS:1 n=1 Tax=Funneliformis caledonium TaxID=1117310 RepID=A0A9N9CQB0_9GLOM|nr:15372_t:CDS:2 [Funneliformis caledonium]